MRGRRFLWAVAVTVAVAAGCAPVTSKPESGAPPAAKEAAPVMSTRARLAMPYQQRAAALEAEGRLREALEARQIALTIDPQSPEAQEAVRRLAAAIERTVALKIQEGRAALARGSHVEARRRFLAALALDPSSRTAFEALRNETRDVETIPHTIRAGETLVALAQRYYGDPARAEVIAETNRLTPNARVAPGTVLNIPEIPGVPFLRPEAKREVAATPRPEPAPPPGARVESGKVEPGKEEPAETNPMVLEAREALERKDFLAAVGDADKILAGTPGHPDALAVKKAALYGLGKVQFAQQKYQESYGTFTQLAKLSPEYEDASTLLQQSRLRLVEYHYGEGVRLYREEKLREAIAQWRIVLELDPQHANAKRNLEQSERLLRGLEERRKR